MLKRAAGRDRRTSAKARSKSTSGGAPAISVGLAFLALAAWPSPDGCDLERRLEQDRGEQRFRPRNARGRQGQVAARWPSATLDRRWARRPTKIRSGRGDVARQSKKEMPLTTALTTIAP